MYRRIVSSNNRTSLANLLNRQFSHLTKKNYDVNNSKNLNNFYKIHTTSILNTFWERERKGGYDKNLTKTSQKKLILDGLKELKQEIGLWKDEVKEKIESDPILVFRPGETDVVWNFKTENDVDQWVITADSDHNEGQSTANLEVSSSGNGLFHGYVDTVVPKDGKIKRAGYCNIKSLRARVSLYFFFLENGIGL